MGSIYFQPYIDRAIENSNDKIVKEILIDESQEQLSNITGDEIETICTKISNSDISDNCRDQLDGTKKSGQSEDNTISYWKAVSKGYEGTISEFIAKKSFWAKTLNLVKVGAGLGIGLLSRDSNQGNAPANTSNERRRLSVSSRFWIAFGVVGLVGVGVFFALRTKKK